MRWCGWAVRDISLTSGNGADNDPGRVLPRLAKLSTRYGINKNKHAQMMPLTVVGSELLARTKAKVAKPRQKWSAAAAPQRQIKVTKGLAKLSTLVGSNQPTRVAKRVGLKAIASGKLKEAKNGDASSELPMAAGSSSNGMVPPWLLDSEGFAQSASSSIIAIRGRRVSCIPRERFQSVKMTETQ